MPLLTRESVFTENEIPHGAKAKQSLRTTVAVAGCGIFTFINVYATQPLLPLLGQVFQVSKVELGMTVSGVTIGLALSAPVFGALAENADRRRVIVTSLILLTFATLAVATAPTIEWLIIWRVLQGLILPGVFTSVIAYINAEHQGRRVGQLMRIYVSGTVLGGFLGRLITGEMAGHYSWRSGFYVLSGLTLLGGIFISMTLPPPRPRSHADSHAIVANLLALPSNIRNPRLLPLCFIGFSILFSLVATFTYVTYYLAAAPFRLNTEQLSWLFSVYLFGLLTTPMSALILHRVNTRWTVIAALVLSLTGVLITLVPYLPLVMLGLILCSSGVFIGQAAALSHLRHVTDERRAASASGFYFAFYYLGGTVGGILPGYFWMHGGWTATVFAIVAVQVLTVVAAFAGLHTTNEAELGQLEDLVVDGSV